MYAIIRTIIVFTLSATLVAAQPLIDDEARLKAVTEALFAPGRNLLDVKLAVDALVDPTSNPAAVAVEVDRMTRDISTVAGPLAPAQDKLTALRRYLYEPGEWNGQNPFRYDFDDPLGDNPENRSLQRYLATRRGNCVTMPILFAVLGQRLGLDMTLAEAPLHLLVKYTDEAGAVWNLEATSGGGFTRDLWYRRKLPMSDEAVANGIYLRPLSHAEATAVIASFLVEHYLAVGEFEQAVAVADVLLTHYPRFAYGQVKKGSAYAGMLRRELEGRYARIEDIPPDLKAKADKWYRENLQAFAKAEALGWRPEDGQSQ
ncbi:regulator of sirC expression with transglutaminase-like and TPR domain [Hoeflea marina]|uniref:Regulator of sirC expression with transglutaminase-like and TPR domain n=1 Tax=Hoeflea marina TaxID=274592 RepID=A0A317PVZ1_9HYPH|nr:transglutaminase family protein [Hoeflea marina]PWW04456.1 regulator of sirC expression with transglutaminase-like and TPR domain [Hoeflea marina]